jgi:hypothetical protein
MADETHLGNWVNAAGRVGTRGFFDCAWSTEDSVDSATEQRARIEADALDATIQQQAIEQTFALALGEELFVRTSTANGRSRASMNAASSGKVAGEAFQLQPQRRNSFAERAEQIYEGFGGGQLIAQVTAVADVTGKLGGEAKVFGHGLGPALHGAGGLRRRSCCLRRR